LQCEHRGALQKRLVAIKVRSPVVVVIIADLTWQEKRQKKQQRQQLHLCWRVRNKVNVGASVLMAAAVLLN